MGGLRLEHKSRPICRVILRSMSRKSTFDPFQTRRMNSEKYGLHPSSSRPSPNEQANPSPQGIRSLTLGCRNGADLLQKHLNVYVYCRWYGEQSRQKSIKHDFLRETKTGLPYYNAGYTLHPTRCSPGSSFPNPRHLRPNKEEPRDLKVSGDGKSNGCYVLGHYPSSCLYL
jgi:hypothetical protein